jgi:hypothetical protein
MWQTARLCFQVPDLIGRVILSATMLMTGTMWPEAILTGTNRNLLDRKAI